MTALGSRMLAALATSLLLVLVGLAAFPRAQKPGMVSAPQWEYKTVPYYFNSSPTADDSPSKLVERLKHVHEDMPRAPEWCWHREGSDGWEVADFIPEGGPTSGRMIFKRIRQSPAE